METLRDQCETVTLYGYRAMGIIYQFLFLCLLIFVFGFSSLIVAQQHEELDTIVIDGKQFFLCISILNNIF